MQDNLILATDSYKITHWNQYPPDTQRVYSYFESREGAKFDNTVFFGLQHILRDLEGRVVTGVDADEARMLSGMHFGNDSLFNMDGWMHVIKNWGGRLPVEIRAVPEGTVVPAGNVMMTVENTDEKCYWLTNALESILTHVWYPSTVATQSRAVKVMLEDFLVRCGSATDGLQFMLHDFGYRGATTHDAAAIGGAAHLVNFVGTDTLPAMLLARDTYGADLDSLAFSVPATEHSVMTARGRMGEFEVVQQLLYNHPNGILSIVADSYNIYDFVDGIGGVFKDQIMSRNGKIVVRPDSVTREHPNPGLLVVDLLERLWRDFGGTVTSKGFRVLDPHVGMIWGDGIDARGIKMICGRAMAAGFSVENLVFGMGGGLLQKVNRDTQRFAFKSSAQKRSGVWHDIQKKPLDSSKRSKAGRLALVKFPNGNFATIRKENSVGVFDDHLIPVFRNGEILNRQTFSEIRDRAAI